MKTFRPSPIASALIAGGFALSAMPLMAQETDAEEKDASEQAVEVIKVSGIRAALQRSQAIKQDNTSVVEVITAEDIGKLPDSSIAESIARLPGLAAQRLDGRASSITIRGLGEDFSVTTLNGREQVSIGDNRGVEFDIYPSELINAVVVQKTPDATLQVQGIGGTIDLQTIRPLASGEQVISFNVRGEYNDIGALNPDGEDTGVRGSFAYVDQFADDTIGVALAYAHLSSPNNEERWNAWGYTGSGTDDDPFFLGGAKPFVRSSELTRDSLMGVLEFRPNDRTRINIDALYIDFEDEQQLRGIEIPGAFGTFDNGFVGSVDNLAQEDGFVTQGRFNEVGVVVRNDFQVREAELNAFGFNLEHDISDYWSIEIDAAYSQVDRRIFSLESYAGLARGNRNGVDNITFNLGEGALGALFDTEVNYGDFNQVTLGNGLEWGNPNVLPAADAQDGFLNIPEVDDEVTTLKLIASRVFDGGMFSSVDFGVFYSDREKQRIDNGFFLTVNDYPNRPPVPEEFRLGTVSLDFIGIPSQIAYDSVGLFNSGFYTETFANPVDGGRIRSNWTVREEVTTAFVKGNIDTELFGFPVTGNVGVQAVYTDQSSDGFATIPLAQDLDGDGEIDGTFEDVTPSTGGASYTELLPSMNLNFEVADGHFVRFGASRTLSRQRLDDMNASFGFSFDRQRVANTNPFQSPWSGSGGNAELRPYIANQLDLSYENYFSDEGYYAIALYYKDLKNWQFNAPSVFDFSDIPIPFSDIDPADVGTNLGIISQPRNTDGGFVRGAEFTAFLPFNIISDALDGFGMIASATYTDSAVSFEFASSFDENGNPSFDSVDITVPGLSRQIYNATLFYEKNGWQIRTSLRKRGDFLGEVAAISFTREPVQVEGASIWDAQIAYDFGQAGIESLEGLIITLQGQNLSDEPFITRFPGGDDRLVRDFQTFGRNYLFGISYTF